MRLYTQMTHTTHTHTKPKINLGRFEERSRRIKAKVTIIRTMTNIKYPQTWQYPCFHTYHDQHKIPKKTWQYPCLNAHRWPTHNSHTHTHTHTLSRTYIHTTSVYTYLHIYHDSTERYHRDFMTSYSRASKKLLHFVVTLTTPSSSYLTLRSASALSWRPTL